MITSRIAFVLTVGIAASCAASPRVRAARPSSLAPPPGAARVVFVRPSRAAPKIAYTLFDERGRYLGDSMARSHFSVDLPPGHHVFLNSGNHTDALAADLAAGRTYFVEVVPHKREHFAAIAPGGRLWDRRDRLVARTKTLAPNPTQGQAFLDGRAARVKRRIDRGMSSLSGYRDVEKARHTLRVTDGA
jgi:hypothetical protein